MQILWLCGRRAVAMERWQRTNRTCPMFSQCLPPCALQPSSPIPASAWRRCTRCAHFGPICPRHRGAANLKSPACNPRPVGTPGASSGAKHGAGKAARLAGSFVLGEKCPRLGDWTSGTRSCSKPLRGQHRAGTEQGTCPHWDQPQWFDGEETAGRGARRSLQGRRCSLHFPTKS